MASLKLDSERWVLVDDGGWEFGWWGFVKEMHGVQDDRIVMRERMMVRRSGFKCFIWRDGDW